MDIESVKLYRRLGLGVPMIPLRPPPEAAAGAKAPPPIEAGRGSGFDPSRSAPKPMVFATRKLTVTNSGPRPKLRFSTGSSGDGFGSSNPYRVRMSPGFLGSVGMPGLLLNSVVPKR